MFGKKFSKGLLIVLILSGWACRSTTQEVGKMEKKPGRTWTDQEAAEIARRMSKYIVVPMKFNARSLDEENRQVLRELLRAAQLADEVFWRQTYAGNRFLREKILKTRTPDDPVRKFFIMQAGPYDRLDHDKAFMDVPPKPPGAGFYPDDMTREEFEGWLKAHPEDKEAFLNPYTVIRRKGDRLVAVRYHEEYKDLIEPMAAALERAAMITTHAGLKQYLKRKAEAVKTDNYYEADVSWIDLHGHTLDLTLGPFEVYEDTLNNIKAAYEASVEVVDREESSRLDMYKDHLDELEDFLPYSKVDEDKRGTLTASFVIVQDVYRGGQIRTGYQPVAANLPNDPRVHMTKGTKKTFWKNVLQARVNYIILPIAQRLVVEDQRDGMTPQGLFDFILLHEIAHGLGPRYVQGTKTPVNVALRDLYSWIEENKADIVGLHSLRWLREHGVIEEGMRRQHLVSYLGSLFRTIRFGTGESHGKAAIVSLNYLTEMGGIDYDENTKRFGVVFARIDAAIEALAHELLLIEAKGDYDRARALERGYAETPVHVSEALQRLEDIPIDVVPDYEITW